MSFFKKGLATRKEEGRAYRYAPTMSPAELRLVTLANVLDSVFGGSVADLKATLRELESRPNRKK